MLLNCIAEGNGTINIKRIGAQWDKVSTTKWEGGKCCKDLILPQNPGFARKPHCLSASKSTAGFSLKSRKRGVSRQNRKVATLPSGGSVADGRKTQAASTLYHTAKGSLPKLSGTSNWPLMIFWTNSTPATTRVTGGAMGNHAPESRRHGA
jgi:hypothetical protein